MSSVPGQTVLVTGATGFLGRRVVRRLAEAGTPVRALVRPGAPEDVLAACLEGISTARVEIAPASFGDDDALRRAVDGAAVILHVAASKSGSAASQVANTVVGSERLFRAAIDAGRPRVVLVSSFGVIGSAQAPRLSTIDESTPMDPHPEWRDAYSFTKHRQETLAWSYFRDLGLPLVVVRPAPIFGPGQPLLVARVGLSAFGWFLHLGGGNTVPLTYVDNCADAVVQAGVAPGIEGEIFCVVDDDLPTSRQVLKLYRRRVGGIRVLPVPFMVLRRLAAINAWYSRRTHNHLPPVFTPYKVDTMWKPQRYSNAKAKSRLGWTPRVPMHEALDRTIAAVGRPS